VAAWDGQGWQPVGGSLPNGAGYALTVYRDALILGGTFSQIGGQSAHSIARWDGASRSPLGSGLDYNYCCSAANVWALPVSDTALITGGDFMKAGGQLAYQIARWDGASWSPLGFGINGVGVYALTGFAGKLIVGGAFAYAGNSPASSIARWDGRVWSELQGGVKSADSLSQSVNALCVWQNELYVGGAFTQAGTEAASGLGRWTDGAATAAQLPRQAGERRDAAPWRWRPSDRRRRTRRRVCATRSRRPVW
jgi:hypothetical protein